MKTQTLPTQKMKAKLETQFSNYLTFCRDARVLRPATIESYADVFSRFRKLMPEVTNTDGLTIETMDAFFRRLHQQPKRIGSLIEAKPLKASTIRSYGSRLHAFCDWLTARGHLRTNPIDASKLPKPIYDDPRALTPRDIQLLLGAIAQQSTDPLLLRRDLAMVHVFTFCGLRRGEFLALRVDHVNLAKRLLAVKGTTSKSRFTRHMPIHPVTATYLEDYVSARRKANVRTEGLWVTHHRGVLTGHGLVHWVRKLRRWSGVRFHVHQFRHTYACMLGRANVNTVKIQKLMGHTDLRMTQSYLRSLGVEDLRDAVEGLSLDDI